MSQLGLGAPINAGLNFNPLGAGNPYAGISAGPAGLAAQYGQSYANALSANQQNYNNVINGYQTVMKNVGDLLGQGGTPWGVAGPAAQAIADTYAQQSGGAFQNSINAGLGNTTAAQASQRGASYDASKAYAGLGAQLAQTAAGYSANLGQGQLNFMNSVNIPYPDAGQYNSLYQQYGQTQQANADRAQALTLAQRQQRFVSPQSPGGVSVGPAPRGGTYGSGGGGYPSGGAVGPTAAAKPSAAQIPGDNYMNWGQSASGAMNVGSGVVGGSADAISQMMYGMAGNAAGGAIGAGLNMGDLYAGSNVTGLGGDSMGGGFDF